MKHQPTSLPALKVLLHAPRIQTLTRVYSQAHFLHLIALAKHSTPITRRDYNTFLHNLQPKDSILTSFSVFLLQGLGQIAFEDADYAAARKHLTQILAMNPNDHGTLSLEIEHTACTYTHNTHMHANTLAHTHALSHTYTPSPTTLLAHSSSRIHAFLIANTSLRFRERSPHTSQWLSYIHTAMRI